MSSEAPLAIPPPARQYHKVTNDRLERLLRALESGYTRTSACRLAGISRKHFYELLADSNHTFTPDFLESGSLTFRELVEAAEAAAEAAAENMVLKLIPRDPKLLRWWLERRRAWDLESPEARQRIEESRQRVRLAELEERLAEIELIMLRREREIPGEENDPNASSSTSTTTQSATCEIEIEYIDIVPTDDSDT